MNCPDEARVKARAKEAQENRNKKNQQTKINHKDGNRSKGPSRGWGRNPNSRPRCPVWNNRPMDQQNKRMPNQGRNPNARPHVPRGQQQEPTNIWEDDAAIIQAKATKQLGLYADELSSIPTTSRQHPATGGHGHYCKCEMCLDIFDRTPTDHNLGPQYRKLMEESLLSMRQGNPNGFETVMVKPASAHKKRQVAQEMVEAMKEMEGLVSKYRITRHAPLNTIIHSVYPDIRIVILDEDRIFGNCRVEEYFHDASHDGVYPRDLHPTLQIPNSLRIETQGWDFRKPHTKMGAISRMINILNDYNSAMLRSEPLKIYMICGANTVQRAQMDCRNGSGVIAAQAMIDWVDREINHKNAHITWLGTGLGLPMSLTKEYRNFSEMVTSLMNSQNLRSCDIFREQVGDREGRLTSAMEAEALVGLRPYLMTEDPRALPAWVTPKGYYDKRETAIQQDGNSKRLRNGQEEPETVMTMYIRGLPSSETGDSPPRKYANTREEGPKCTHCMQLGHTGPRCEGHKKPAGQPTNSTRGTRAEVALENSKRKRALRPEREIEVRPTEEDTDLVLSGLFQEWVSFVEEQNDPEVE